jgi:hypothetical protein
MRQTRQILIPGTEAINIQDQTEIKPLAVLKFNPNLEVTAKLFGGFDHGTESTRSDDIGSGLLHF